ncbi:hypothetical protein EV356DRAFT_498188 [Viridothelium virens]|uniref:SART-1 protein n=1 Tax=Viridothelium virens TaxID=1048519 RepID=A0A6A6HFD3_VIRVR|nr:hypothetical protein EV356DRAFT_498188 [Viridothelium virens]
MAEGLDLEEANRVRKALGMAPLPVSGTSSGPVFKESKDDNSSSDEDEPASTLETREAAGFNNWEKLKGEQEARAKREAQKEAIRKAREHAQRFSKLEGKGLGEADDAGDVDTKTWLRQQKKRQKQIDKARRLEEELAEREKQAAYTSADLAGVRVGHEVDAFGEEAEHILTLKDTAVDDEDEQDELENLDLKEREKLHEKLELKKNKPAYNPNDVAAAAEKKSLLGQYDEVIDGKKEKRFTLDGQGSTREVPKLEEDLAPRQKGVKISLDLFKDETPISDYVDPSEIKVKKPKKKKSKSTRQRPVDEDEDKFQMTDFAASANAMDADGAGPGPHKKRNLDDFNDDEDLQAQLAQQRRQALKKRKKMRPEDVAQQLREEGSATPAPVSTIEDREEEPGLILDETSEFVANLQNPVEKEPHRRSYAHAPSAPSGSPFSDEEASKGGPDDSYDAVASDEEGSKARIRRESSTNGQEITNTGLAEEETVNGSIGGLLNMLTNRGLIDRRPEEHDLNQQLRDRQAFLYRKQKREEEIERKAREQRERDRKSGRLDRMSNREREEYARQTNQSREALESRTTSTIFEKEYKPNFELKYVDDFGRHMNEKEAFKHLSHQFHGKGSGKQKQEKHLKKVADEKKREAQSALDSSQATGMNNVGAINAKKNRSAGVRLQ